MTDGEALLAAVIAHPDDDTPRLVYADWLDEHAADDRDRATAEFIRVSCGGVPDGATRLRSASPWIEANWRRLVPRLAAELAARGATWASWPGSAIGASVPVTRAPAPVIIRMKFRRGFVGPCCLWAAPAGVSPGARPRALALWELVRTDQPLARCERDGAVSVSRRDNGRYVQLEYVDPPVA